MTCVEGDFDLETVWTVSLSRKRQMHPRLIKYVRGKEIQFDQVIGGSKWVVRLTHSFIIEPRGPGQSCLRQEFKASGLLAGILWVPLYRGMVQFEQLGLELASHLARTGTT